MTNPTTAEKDLRAANAAVVDEIRRALGMAGKPGSAIDAVRNLVAELASLQRERDRLVRELETARDYVVCALQEERQKFAGYLHCSEVADIANDLASIDAILNTARGAGNGRGDGN